jgi:signal transduction histidine kinase
LSYRLTHTDGRPYDDNWVACENAKGFVRYPNLPAGEYYFDIRGSNSDGKFSPNIKRLYLKIRPPFYQTTQFYLMMFLAIASILYIIVREVFRHQLRLKNIQLREQRIAIEKQDALTQERNRIAAEMHDDFGSGLTAIQRISERAAINASSPDARKAIENITSYSLELIGNMREIIWAMSGKNDNLENLMAYISENAYRYLGNHNIDVDILQPEEIPDLEISGERRRNIYLAVKESLHNVVKHAQASSVAISFEINGMLEIHVRDNGKGFENKNLLGYGMGNMAKRMEDIGGKMTLLNNGGAHLKFSIPIEKFKPR